MRALWGLPGRWTMLLPAAALTKSKVSTALENQLARSSQVRPSIRPWQRHLPPPPAGVKTKLTNMVSLCSGRRQRKTVNCRSSLMPSSATAEASPALPVTAKPVIPGLHWDAKIPLILDRNAPPNEMLTYRVFSVDVFGRRSAGTSIRIFFPDFHALEPPQPVNGDRRLLEKLS